ncbi:MAG: amidohydrolase family protein [Actinobacteria bacterium]|nr:amidohydrolase family protein [Actinomycetota bacterium]
MPRVSESGRVIDLWVNVIGPRASRQWLPAEERAGANALFGDDLFGAEHTPDDLVASLDDAGVDVGLVTLPFRSPAVEEFLDATPAHASRLLVAAAVNEPGRRPPRPKRQVERVRELAELPRVTLIRVTPFLDQVPLDDARYYPLYAACEELGLPVSINVGVPGPRAESDCQHPRRLERVLVDFPELTVIGAHMGHPYESLLVTYMMKWDRLFLSNSAYLADYMDEGLVRFMNSSRGRGRVLFASDHPVLPVGRALESARKLPLDEEAMAEFLGNSAARVLGLGSTNP